MAQQLRLGDVVPDFSQVYYDGNSEGRMSFHEYINNSWCILFSHPADYTPVCTTELGRAANMKDDFAKRNVKMVGLSVDSLDSHKGWVADINETQGCRFNFPLVADEDRSVSILYGMLHPNSPDTLAGKLTVRSVFVIDHNKKLRMSLTYPASTGRNFNELLRVIDSLQLTDNHKVATPVDWTHGDDCVIVPSIKTEDAGAAFPKGFTAVKPYLRMTPQPDQ